MAKKGEKIGDPMPEVDEKCVCPTMICTGPTCLINIARSLRHITYFFLDIFFFNSQFLNNFSILYFLVHSSLIC